VAGAAEPLHHANPCLAQVIKGWTEAMQLMVEGDKWEMYIPSELGYGDRGSPPKIPGGSVLVFRMEILKIKGDKKPAVRCDVLTEEHCSDRQKEFIQKQKSKEEQSAGHIATELARLSSMKQKKMKPELEDWLNQRVSILKKLKDEL
jgi:hypothetical protein